MSSSTAGDVTGGTCRSSQPTVSTCSVRRSVTRCRPGSTGKLPGSTTPPCTGISVSAPACRAFAHDAEDLHRAVRLEPAPPIPDLAPSILLAIGDDTRAGAAGAARDRGELVTLLRWLLVALAVVQIAVAVPALLGSDAGLPVHTARHLGSFDVAIAVGFLFAAWKPSRIAGMLPVLGALAVCLVISALLDVAAGQHRGPEREPSHHRLRRAARDVADRAGDPPRRSVGVMIRRLVARALAALVAALVGCAGRAGGAPASAHASLLGSEPTPGGVYSSSPSAVTLRFSEPVEVALGGVRVFAASTETRVETGAPDHPDGNGSYVTVDLPKLDDGTFVVTWRVISADSHPIEGAFTFQVGPTASVRNAQGLATSLLEHDQGSRAVGVVYGIQRGVLVGVARVADRRARLRRVRVAEGPRQPPRGLAGAGRLDRRAGRDRRGHRAGGRVRRGAAARQGVRPQRVRRRHRHALRPRRVGAARGARVCVAAALVRLRSRVQLDPSAARLVADPRRAGRGGARAHPGPRRSPRLRDPDRSGHPDGRAPRARHGPVARRSGGAGGGAAAPARHRRVARRAAPLVEAGVRVCGHARRHRHLPGVARGRQPRRAARHRRRPAAAREALVLPRAARGRRDRARRREPQLPRP